MKKILLFVFLLNYTQINLAAFVDSSNEARETVDVHIFVHGTGVAAESIRACPLSVFRNKKHKILDYIRESYRKVEYVYRRSLMPKSEGFFDITNDDFYLNDDLVHSKNDHIIPTMRIFKKIIRDNFKERRNNFFCHSWSGGFSRNDRQKAGEDLCQNLKNIEDEYAKNNLIPKFYIYGYSGGGEVAAYVSKFAPKYNLISKISWLYLLAPPVDNAVLPELINNRVFENVVLCHSKGDKIQSLDYFSTTYKKSWTTVSQRSFKGLNNIYQCECFANGKPVDHYQFFFPKKFYYQLPVFFALPKFSVFMESREDKKCFKDMILNPCLNASGEWELKLSEKKKISFWDYLLGKKESYNPIVKIVMFDNRYSLDLQKDLIVADECFEKSYKDGYICITSLIRTAYYLHYVDSYKKCLERFWKSS